MAGKYTKQELREMLQASAYHIVATEGVEHCTVRRVSSGCGLSDPYIYQCYSDLQDLMLSAYLEIDGRVSDKIYEALKNTVFSMVTADDVVKISVVLWRAYWKTIMDKPEETIFYWRYYQSAYYNQEVYEIRKKNYRYFVKFIEHAGEKFGLSDKFNLSYMVSNLVDNTVSCAVKIHLGYFDAKDIEEKKLFQAVFANLFHHIGKDVWSIDDVWSQSN